MRRPLIRCVYEARDYLRSISPYDTGILRETISATRIEKNAFKISIGGPPAPYAVYTNEKWVSPRWKGKKNPNEKWIDMGVQQVVKMIAEKIGGEISFNQEDEIRRWNNQNYWDSPEGQKKLKEYNML